MSKKALTGEQKAQIENNRLAALERKRVRENARLEQESLKAAKQKKSLPFSQVMARIMDNLNLLSRSSYYMSHSMTEAPESLGVKLKSFENNSHQGLVFSSNLKF